MYVFYPFFHVKGSQWFCLKGYALLFLLLVKQQPRPSVTVAQKTITGKTLVSHAYQKTAQKSHLCLVLLAEGQGRRSICIMGQGTWRWIMDDCSQRAAAKNTSSGVQGTLGSAARPWPGLMSRGNSRKAIILCRYVVVRIAEMVGIISSSSTGTKMRRVNYWSKRQVGAQLFHPAGYKFPFIILACISLQLAKSPPKN